MLTPSNQKTFSTGIALAVIGLLCMLVEPTEGQVQRGRGTVAKAGSHWIWNKPTDTSSSTWTNVMPTARDVISFTFGENRVDATPYAASTSPAETKFDMSGAVPGGKALTTVDRVDSGPLGSVVRCSGGGSSARNTIDGTTTWTCRWRTNVVGRLGNKVRSRWNGYARGNDPYHVLPEDFANMGITDGWDALIPVGLDPGTELGLGGSIALNVYYDTASSTTQLLSLYVDINGVTTSSDAPLGLEFFPIPNLEEDPRNGFDEAITLEELKTLLESDLIPDRTLDSPLYIGIVWEDIPIPTVDLGNGAVARFRIETEVTDQAVAEVVEFQQGVDDYHDLRDMIIGNDIDNGNGSIPGFSVESERLSGRYGEPNDRQGLLHFENIENIIPPDARILEATLELFTSNNPNAESFGPYAPSQLLVPFDEFNSFNDPFGGFQFFTGDTNRPHANGFVEMLPSDVAAADVTQMVQNWVNGQPNHGLAVTSGTHDEWGPFWSGVGQMGLNDPFLGPRLTVAFTQPDPLFEEFLTLADSSNPMAQMHLADVLNDVLFDANQSNPDGEFLNGGNQEIQALFRFDNLFESQGGSIPDNAVIKSASLWINTASSNFSQNSGTMVPYAVRPILDDWNGGTPFSNLNFGNFEHDQYGMIANSTAKFDILKIVQAWQDGSPNFGLNIAALGQNDDWGILTSAAQQDQVPRLLIQWEPADPIVVLPDSITVTRGTKASGGRAQIIQSDNQDISIQRRTSDIQSRTAFEVSGFSPTENPSFMEIMLEGAVFARSPVTQTIELWDYDAGQWESVDSRTAARFTDSTVIAAPDGDLARFVEDGTRALLARVRYNSQNPRQQFSSNTDLFTWTFGQQ